MGRKKKLDKYNMLTILHGIDTPKEKHQYSSWDFAGWVRCKCDCGNEKDLPYYGVLHGYIKSCGCYRAECSRQVLAKNKESENFTSRIVTIEYKGEKHNLTEWSNITGIPKSTLRYRYNKGMSPRKILKEYSIKLLFNRYTEV